MIGGVRRHKQHTLRAKHERNETKASVLSGNLKCKSFADHQTVKAVFESLLNVKKHIFRLTSVLTIKSADHSDQIGHAGVSQLSYWFD